MAEPKTSDTSVEKKKRTPKRKASAPEPKLETMLWAAADKLRGHMDAAEYKHVVLGLIFLKYISDAFEEHRKNLEAQISDPANELYVEKSMDRYATLEDRDEYTAANIFWVPQEARWAFLQGRAKQPTIGKLIDDTMVAIERDNPSLKSVLPKDYARPALDKQQLGELIDLIAKVGLGDKANRSQDVLGRVYEYFLGQFASAEGKKGGQFYTARCVVHYSSRCWRHTKDASSIRVVVPAGCLCRARSLSKRTAGASATSASSVRSRIPRPGSWRR